MPPRSYARTLSRASLMVAAALLGVTSVAKADNLNFGVSANSTVRLLASDWADYQGNNSSFDSANAGGRLYWRGTAGDGQYMHFDLSRLQGASLTGGATLTLQNTNSTWGGGVSGSFIATANGAWWAASGTAVPGATAIADATNANGSYGSGTSVSWGVGQTGLQALISEAATFKGFAVIGGSGSQMHFDGPMNPYLTVTTASDIADMVTVVGGATWSNYAFSDGVLNITGEVAPGSSGAGAVTINALGTVSVDNTTGYNHYWAVDSTRINAGGMLILRGHSHLHNLTLAGGELAGIRPDGSYGTWELDDATTVTGGGVSTISALRVKFANGNITIDDGSTLRFSGSVREGNMNPTIGAGAKLVNAAAPGTSLSLGALTLNGGELAATSAPAGNLGSFQLRGTVTVGGTAMSTISADVRVGDNSERVFDVADVASGDDLLLTNKIGHFNGISGGSFVKAGAGTMRISGTTEVYRGIVNAGTLILGDTAIEGWWGGGLTTNASVEMNATGTRTASYAISGSGSLTKSGNGTLTLTSLNTFSGGTTVGAGILNIDVQGDQTRSALGMNKAVSVASGATLRLNKTDGLGYHGANPSSLTIAGTMTIAAGIHASIANYGLTLDGGTLTSEGAGSGNGNYILDGTVTTLSNATQSVISANTIWLRNGSGAANQAVVFDVADGAAATDLSVSSVLTNGNGANGLTKTGGGALALSGSNTYSGGTTINAGTLTAVRNSLGSGAVVVNNGGTLYANDQWVFCGVNGYGEAQRNVASLTLNAGSTLYMDPTNGFANGISNFYLNGGSVTGGANADTRGALFLFNGNEQITAGGGVTSTIGVSLGLNGNNNSITVTAGSRLDMTNVLKNGAWSPAGGFVKNGAGTIILSGANTYGGQTDIIAGTLLAASNTALGSGGHAGETQSWIHDGATLALQGGISLDEHFHVWGAGVDGLGAVRSLSGNNVLSNAPNGGPGFCLRSNTTVGVDADTLTVSGFYEDGGSFGLTKVGNGTLVLNVLNSYTGGTTVNGGTLSLLGNGGNGRIRGALTVNAGGTVVTKGDGTGLGYNAQLSSLNINGGLVKAESGTMSHIWNITGGVTMTGGELQVNDGTSDAGGQRFDWNWTALSTLAGTSSAVVSGRVNLRDDTSYSSWNISVADGAADVDLLVSAAVTQASGAVGITKSGNGKMTLSGVNSYTGATIVSGGTLVLEAGGTYAYTGGNISINGGSTLRVSGQAYTFNGKTIAFGAAGGGTLDAIATGAGGMYQTGDNTISTSGGAQNTLSGTRIGDQNQGINLNWQTLAFDVAVGAEPAVPNLNITGTLWNAGNLTKSGNGILLLSGDSQYSGATTVNAGTLVFRGASASASHAIATGAVLEFDVGSGSRNLNTAGFTGAGALRKTGAGEIVWGSGTATFALDAGALIDVRAGTFKGGSHANENWTNNKSDLNVESGATFNTVEANVRVNKITGTGTIRTGYDGSAGYQNLTIGVDNGSSTFGGVIENADATGNVVKAGTGAITLSGTNTYSGSTTVNDGTLKVTTLGTTGGSSLGSSDRANAANLLLNGPVTLEYAGAGESTSRSFTVSGTGLTLTSTGSGALNFTADSSIAFAADGNSSRQLKLAGSNTGANTFGSSLSGSPADADKINKITKDGVGTWILSGPANRFRGDVRLEINSGTLGLTSGAVGSSMGSIIELYAGATLRWEAGNTDDLSARLYFLPDQSNTEATVAITSGLVVFANPLGSGSDLTLVKTGAGTLELNADQTELDGVRVTAGRLTAKTNGSLGLYAATVTGGTLSIAQGVSVANDITVSSGGTLAGKGTTGDVTVASGGILSPGSSPGVLTHSNLSLAGGSTINWEVYDATGAGGVGYDRLIVNGDLDLTGASSTNKVVLKIISLSALDTNGNPLNFGAPAGIGSIRTFQFGQVGGLVLTNGENISDLFRFDLDDFRYTDGSSSNAALWSINWNSGTGAITLTAVPEPSTYGLGLGALALTAAALRRRRQTPRT